MTSLISYLQCDVTGRFSVRFSRSARIRGARRILEIGTLGGYSTIWLARALPSDGKLVTLELEPSHVGLVCKNIEAAGLSSVGSVSRVIGDRIRFYNHRRPHQALTMKTPAEAFALAAPPTEQILLGQHRRTAIQTVGSKGWDGFSISVVSE